MSNRLSSLLCALAIGALASSVAAAPAAPTHPIAWVELTASGPEVRAVSPDGGCPQTRLDGAPVEMRPRAAADADFPLVCVLALPTGAHGVEVAGQRLTTPKRQIDRIVVFGDSGCRLKGPLAQACNDPRAWPFAAVAAHAAAHRPDLVIHVGDYYYRETPCPAGDLRCAGSPSGDRWDAWAADFFDPSSPLLAAAPWVFVRGNHESCKRGARGWFRLLDAGASVQSCPDGVAAPWRTNIGGLDLYILDSADTVDDAAPPERVKAFADQLDALSGPLARERGWIVVHRPVWGLAPAVRLGPLGPVDIALNRTEQAAVRGRDLSAVEMVLSGHIHHFSSFDFGSSRPAQLIVGTGGDIGLPADTTKVTTREVSIDGLDALRTEFDRFGYLVLDRARADGALWRGVFYDADDRPVVDCSLDGRELKCAKP